ncbi:MAG: FkbM family methyltransferase [Oscillochloridaceae bacterium]|nr:FkbM family methyltransferase [Chloroflexaceae bacterium]MDW8388729.1 FkbM family methyltransferase [Oscillochloridaceae bacterium]
MATSSDNVKHPRAELRSEVQNRDKVRTAIRRVINVRGPIYQSASRLLNRYCVIKSEGFGVYRTLYRQPLPGETQRHVNFKNYPYPIYFRPGTTDVGELVDNLIRHQYGRIDRFIEPELIIDAGGYIGDVSIYFLNRFKNCTVKALEPNPANFAIAKQNLQPYSDRVKLLQKGLWNKEMTLYLSGSFSGASVINADTQGVEIECTTISNLLQSSGAVALDILKIDIEGAELEVLLNGSEWLPRTRLIIAEFHGEYIRKSCIDQLKMHGFRGYQYRSVNYFWNERFRQQ